MWRGHLCLLTGVRQSQAPTFLESLGDRGPIFPNDYISRGCSQVLEKTFLVVKVTTHLRARERIYNGKFSEANALRKRDYRQGLTGKHKYFWQHWAFSGRHLGGLGQSSYGHGLELIKNHVSVCSGLLVGWGSRGVGIRAWGCNSYRVEA